MLAVVVALAIAPPSAAEIQTLEVDRILIPLTDYTLDGRPYVEFSPTVETQRVACTKIDAKRYDCTWETRTRDFLEPDFGPWDPRREQLIRRYHRWRFAGGAE
jgi:hypothetical protein